MALEIKLSQKLTHSLVMTQQLQQAIKLLQLGRLEYLEVIEKELLENPALEDARENNEKEETLAGNEGEQMNGALGDLDDAPYKSYEGERQLSERDAVLEVDRTSAEPISDSGEWLDYADSTWGDFSNSASSRHADESPGYSVEATASKPEGLTSHVLWQLRTTELVAADWGVALQIVGNLDRDGYLQCSSEELAIICGRSVEDVERVLREVQLLDPPGVAARDLRECLLIQLSQQGAEGSLAWKIVLEHLDKVETRQFDKIARQEGIKIEDVVAALNVIQKLEPRPGRPFVDEAPIYITPDIYVKKVDNEYVISLNDTGMPKLRVSPRYWDLLNNPESCNSTNREYLNDRLKSAMWFIKSIHQRQQTIYRITESIMKFQRRFLDDGVGFLRPLVLREVAEDVGMHESTVSRVTTNKYVHTPQGVFELKFFFTSGLKSEQGEDVSSESVKERIRSLILAEDPKRPLSDQALVDTLKSEGVNIARRTVAKYREMMNILSSSRRKKVF